MQTQSVKHFSFAYFSFSVKRKVRVGVYCDEGTPVPIPNTVVKLIYADNTWLVTAREDRSMPTQSDLKKTQIASIFLNSSVGRASDC